MAEYCRRLRPLLREGAVVLGGAMDKYLSKNMLAVLSAKMGPTHTTLGRKKARLSVTRVGPAPDSARPQRQRYRAEPFDLYVTSLPGTFSAQKLDVGTRFLLEHFAQIPIASSRTIADLGCGNGILGVVAAALNPGANVSFFDDSSFAIASARLSVAANFAAEERFDFNHADGLLPDADRLFDVVLCNPPFHLGGQQDTFVAQRLFAQASKALHPDGELWVVGNRHLRYHTSLRRHFVDVSVVASNRKFLLLRARQPRPRHAGASIQSRNE
ncbi:MAG: methyltransferase [Pseudomonadota bacterium]